MSGDGIPPADYTVTGAPTDDELAALITVLQARAVDSSRLHSADDRPQAGGWTSYYRTVRQALVPGRDAWRTYRRLG